MSGIARIGILIDVTDKASSKIDKYSKNTQKAWRDAGLAIAGFGLAAGAGFAAVVKHTAEFSARIARNAKQIGITVEEYQKWEYAAEQVGIKQEVLFDNLRQFNSVIGRAAEGSTEYQKKFTQLGISLKKSNGDLKNANELFLEIADVFKKSKDDAAEAAIAFKLFGETGARLASLANLGREGIKKLSDEAVRLGIVLDADLIGKGLILQRQMDKIKRAFNAIVIVIGTKMIPALLLLGEEFLKFLRAGGRMQTFAENLQSLGRVVLAVGEGFANIAVVIKMLGNILVIAFMAPTSAMGTLIQKLANLGQSMTNVMTRIQKFVADTSEFFGAPAEEIEKLRKNIQIFAKEQKEIYDVMRKDAKDLEDWAGNLVDPAIDGIKNVGKEFKAVFETFTRLNDLLNKPLNFKIDLGGNENFGGAGKDLSTQKQQFEEFTNFVALGYANMWNTMASASDLAMQIINAKMQEHAIFFDKVKNGLMNAGQIIAGAFSSAVVHGTKLNEIVKNLHKQLLAMVVNKLIMFVFSQLVGNFAAGGGGLLGAAFSSLISSASKSTNVVPTYSAIPTASRIYSDPTQFPVMQPNDLEPNSSPPEQDIYNSTSSGLGVTVNIHRSVPDSRTGMMRIVQDEIQPAMDSLVQPERLFI